MRPDPLQPSIHDPIPRRRKETNNDNITSISYFHQCPTYSLPSLLSFTLRGGLAFPGTPAFNWRIYGEKGEIEVIGEGIFYNVGVKSTVRLHNAETGDVEEIDIAENEKQFNEGLGLPAQNIGRVYEGYVELKGVKSAGDSGYKERLVTFEDAYQRHVFIDEGFRRWDAGQQGLLV